MINSNNKNNENSFATENRNGAEAEASIADAKRIMNYLKQFGQIVSGWRRTFHAAPSHPHTPTLSPLSVVSVS